MHNLMDKLVLNVKYHLPNLRDNFRNLKSIQNIGSDLLKEIQNLIARK